MQWPACKAEFKLNTGDCNRRSESENHKTLIFHKSKAFIEDPFQLSLKLQMTREQEVYEPWPRLQIPLGRRLRVPGLLELRLQSPRLLQLLPQLPRLAGPGGAVIAAAAVQQPLVLRLQPLHLQGVRRKHGSLQPLS